MVAGDHGDHGTAAQKPAATAARTELDAATVLSLPTEVAHAVVLVLMRHLAIWALAQWVSSILKLALVNKPSKLAIASMHY